MRRRAASGVRWTAQRDAARLRARAVPPISRMHELGVDIEPLSRDVGATNDEPQTNRDLRDRGLVTAASFPESRQAHA